MNELPNELICMVFNHLNLIDLIDNCRLVSKRWLALVDSIKFKELFIDNLRPVRFDNVWYYTLKPINPNNFMYLHSPINLTPKYLTIKLNNFSDLKRLRISFYKAYLDLDQLNQLIQLEHLELNSLIKLKTNSTLCLPNLRVLYLFEINSKLVIDADKLEVLKCQNLSKMNFIHPESIKFLELEELNEGLNHFVNLEICRFQFSMFQIIRNLNDKESFLSKLPNSLKEFHFDDSDYFNHLIDYYRFILQDKVNRRRSNIKLCLNGIELTNELLDSIQLNTKRLELYHINYEKLTTLPRFRSINYNRLMQVFNNVIPNDFFIKFNSIQTVDVNEMINQDQLIWFLKGCHYLNELTIGRLELSNLNQEFYNQLPKIASSLSYLSLSKHPLRNRIDQIDLNFISEFKFFCSFRTNQHIPSQTAKNLIKNTKFLRRFEFKNEERKVIVLKTPRANKFSIDIVNVYSNSSIGHEIGSEELDKFFDMKFT